MIQKAASTHITWETLGDPLRYSSTQQRTARPWETTTPSSDGRYVPKGCCATNATQPWRGSITQTSTRESTVTDQGATSQRYALSTTLNKKVSMLRRWQKTIESRLKTTSMPLILSKSILTSELNTRHLKDKDRSNRLLSTHRLCKFRIIIFPSHRMMLNSTIHRIWSTVLPFKCKQLKTIWENQELVVAHLTQKVQAQTIWMLLLKKKEMARSQQILIT